MLTSKQRSNLRAIANKLKPEITIGKEGLSDNVINEINNALFHRELIKVSILKSCQIPAQQIMEQVCQKLYCHPVQAVGSKFVVYKFSDKEKIQHIPVD